MGSWIQLFIFRGSRSPASDPSAEWRILDDIFPLLHTDPHRLLSNSDGQYRTGEEWRSATLQRVARKYCTAGLEYISYPSCDPLLILFFDNAV